MKFSEALAQSIETGIGIYRPSWNGNAKAAEGGGVQQWTGPHYPKHSDSPDVPIPGASEPFFVIHQPNGSTPWVPSQGDLFADDWQTL